MLEVEIPQKYDLQYATSGPVRSILCPNSFEQVNGKETIIQTILTFWTSKVASVWVCEREESIKPRESSHAVRSSRYCLDDEDQGGSSISGRST